MQLLKRIFNFYIFSNAHVALATFCLTKITLLLYGKSSNGVAYFVFFATLLSYNYIRLYRSVEMKSWFSDWLRLHRRYLIALSAVSFGALVYLAFHLRMLTLVALIPLGFLTLFYVVPFGGNVSLRTLSGLKLFLIAFCWAAVTVMLPVINHELPFNKDVLLIFIQRMLFVAAITIPFDIRDLAFDSEIMKTVPQVLGIAKAKRLGIFFLMLFLGLNFLKENPSQMLRTEFLITLHSLLLLVRATTNQNKYYSAFLVEAIPIIWLGLLLLK